MKHSETLTLHDLLNSPLESHNQFFIQLGEVWKWSYENVDALMGKSDGLMYGIRCLRFLNNNIDWKLAEDVESLVLSRCMIDADSAFRHNFNRWLLDASLKIELSKLDSLIELKRIHDAFDEEEWSSFWESLDYTREKVRESVSQFISQCLVNQSKYTAADLERLYLLCPKDDSESKKQVVRASNVFAMRG